MPLIRELPSSRLSPYLRQHADNPVDWYIWNEDAFRIAAARDVPILLSIGYSSCHWCHVMAHESFEDPPTAETMNAQFVNIKVDREERPDVDDVYMQATQAMTGQGGWPMTVFLTPDARPFFAGTYFPKVDSHGHPAFARVLNSISEAWQSRRDELLETAGTLHNAIRRSVSLAAPGDATIPGLDQLDAAVTRIVAQFDPRFGGFGRAPKFPQAMTIDFLLRSSRRANSDAALHAALTSLDAMAAGGIADQIGGGFHRYSTDSHWLVPHFEKMLYDQALLIRAYTHAFQLSGHTRYQRVVEATIGAVLRDFSQPDGGFASALDADSEGVEGKFYCWSLEELSEVCADDAVEVSAFFGADERGNFVDPHTGFSGNILHAVSRTAERSDSISRCVLRLFERRSRRIAPGLDTKVLLEWNALFVRSLAEAAVVFDRENWLDEARTQTRFLLSSMRRADGRLLRSYQDGHAQFLAYATDYAALLEALVTMAEVDGTMWLAEAQKVADELLALFHDDDNGGFFTTGNDAEALIVRAKDCQDNALPSANSLAASGLLRLAALTDEERFRAPARAVVHMLAAVAVEHPTAFAHLLGAVELIAQPGAQIVIIGEPDRPDTAALRRAVFDRYLPGAVTLTASETTDTTAWPLLAERPMIEGKATAYVCEGFVCRQPTNDLAVFSAQLDAL